MSRGAQRLPDNSAQLVAYCKYAEFFVGCYWLVGLEGYSSSLQVATAGALLEIVLKNLISAHDAVDFLAPLALALMCQPSTDQVGLLASPSTGCCVLLALGTKAHCLLSCSTKETKAHVFVLCCRKYDKLCCWHVPEVALICAGLALVAACSFHFFISLQRRTMQISGLVEGAGLLSMT